jgi:hypothetical protein
MLPLTIDLSCHYRLALVLIDAIAGAFVTEGIGVGCDDGVCWP